MSRRISGQVIVGAMIAVVVLLIIIPALIALIDRETKWSVKEDRTTRAFQLAEAGVERGFQQLILSTSTWANIQTGTIPSGYNFNQIYTDLPGGQYEIRISSGPAIKQATVTGVGLDTSANELRAIKATYSSFGASNFAITAGNYVNMNGGSTNVVWGAVTSYNYIDATGHNYPRFFSSGNIIGLDPNGPAPPNTDNVQWWSYKTDLPPQPQVDLNSYQSDAQNAGVSPPAGCPASYYITGNLTFSGCIDQTNHTYYATGNVNFASGGTNFIVGNVVAQGNVTTSGNGGTNGSGPGVYVTSIPPKAWLEYGNSWATYQCMDAAAPSSYASAKTSNYLANATITIPTGCINSAGSVLVHGFVYSGGGQGLNGGGNGRFHGVILTPNTAVINTSNFTVYFDSSAAANLKMTNVSLLRSSWAEITGCSWTGANPTCP